VEVLSQVCAPLQSVLAHLVNVRQLSCCCRTRFFGALVSLVITGLKFSAAVGFLCLCHPSCGLLWRHVFGLSLCLCICACMIGIQSVSAYPETVYVSNKHTHTHTHTFNSHFFGTTQVSWYQKGRTSK